MVTEYFRGNAKKLGDLDLPRIGNEIKVGEDVIHMLIEVETRGTGFDRQKRVIMLFEPHIFDKMLRTNSEKRQLARSMGLAYPKWGTKKYPKDSYPRFLKACEIDETAAYASCSWGLGQIMGMNYKMAGYNSPQEMVKDFAESEANQLDAMIEFAKSANIDDDLQDIERILKSGGKVTPQDCIPIARAWNGSGFAKHNYHGRLAAAANKWHRIKDTPFSTEEVLKMAQEESIHSDFENQVFEGDEPVSSELTKDLESVKKTPETKEVPKSTPEEREDVTKIPAIPPFPVQVPDWAKRIVKWGAGLNIGSLGASFALFRDDPQALQAFLNIIFWGFITLGVVAVIISIGVFIKGMWNSKLANDLNMVRLQNYGNKDTKNVDFSGWKTSPDRDEVKF